MSPASTLSAAPGALRSLALAAALGVSVLAIAAPPARAAPVADTIAQRVQACTGCHGPQGRASPDGYQPRIAGKPAGYLYRQLLNFRDGRRHYGLMSGLLEPLSDAYLQEIAEHFASLDLPYPAPLASTAPAASLARGEALVRRGDAGRGLPACVQCHGAAMTGVAPAIPGLLGLPRDYLVAQLGAWKSGQRHALAPDCMARVAQNLAGSDLAAVADWLAAQPLPASAKPADRLAAALPLPCGAAPRRRRDEVCRTDRRCLMTHASATPAGPAR